MKSVLILMSTYNGEKFIIAQLESLLKQTNVDVRILIRDDGSVDRTTSIIKSLHNDCIELIQGENIGYAKSFMTLVHLARERKADYYAFCDQDDIWEPEKLSVAINSIDNSNSKPALYLSQANIVDEDLKPIDVVFHDRIVDLGAVLEHNYAIGCTMVFNASLRELLDIDINNMELTAGHDSWVYLVALAINADIYFDKNGYINYRQHGNNASGKIISLNQALRATYKCLFKWKYMRSKSAKKLLLSYEMYMDNSNRALLRDASHMNRTFKEKIKFIRNERMHSDYKVVDLLFLIAVMFNLF